MNDLAFYSLIIYLVIRVIGLGIALDFYYNTRNSRFKLAILGWGLWVIASISSISSGFYLNQNIINKLSLLSKFPISIFVLNSPFIAAEGGITDTILEALYLKLDKTFNIRNDNGVKVPIGRICLPKEYPTQHQPFKLEDLIKRIKTNLNLEYISYVGDLKKEIKKICIVGGDPPYKDLLKRVIDKGCDCFISGRISYFDAVFARDIGLTLIETSHYKNEILALKRICNLLSLEFPYVEFILFDSKDPYKTYF